MLQRVREITAVALFITMAWTCTGPAIGQPTGTPDKPTLPDTIGEFKRRGDVRDFEGTMPGLGYSVAYYRPEWTLSLYVYDRKANVIPDGPETPEVVMEYQRSKQELLDARQAGIYKSADWVKDFSAPANGKRERFVCAYYVLVARDGRSSDSFLCVSGWRNKFIKLRMTTPRNEHTTHDATVTAAELARYMWPGR